MRALALSPAQSSDTMVPLTRALEEIAAHVYAPGEAQAPMVRTDLFDGLACTVSVLAAMFVLDGGASPRRLAEQELDKALFRNGGAEMYFVDGRPPIVNLAVTREGIAKVIRILRGGPLPD
jgi:hypothetical protein